MDVFEFAEGIDHHDLVVAEDDGLEVVFGDESFDVKGEFVVEGGLGVLGEDAAVELDAFGGVEGFDEGESDVIDEAGGESAVGDEADIGVSGGDVFFEGFEGDVGVSAEVTHIGVVSMATSACGVASSRGRS